MALPRMAFFHDRVLPYADAKLGLLTHALNYGTGVFAGIRGYFNPDEGKALRVSPGRPRAAPWHESARLLRMNLALSEEATAAALLDLLRAEGCARIATSRVGLLQRRVIGVRLHGLHPVFCRGGLAVWSLH